MWIHLSAQSGNDQKNSERKKINPHLVKELIEAHSLVDFLLGVLYSLGEFVQVDPEGAHFNLVHLQLG